MHVTNAFYMNNECSMDIKPKVVNLLFKRAFELKDETTSWMLAEVLCYFGQLKMYL